ncbi:MAG: hypothetical protein ACRD40_19725, partial [Candidatus Acidiferrales bacterium]
PAEKKAGRYETGGSSGTIAHALSLNVSMAQTFGSSILVAIAPWVRRLSSNRGQTNPNAGSRRDACTSLCVPDSSRCSRQRRLPFHQRDEFDHKTASVINIRRYVADTGAPFFVSGLS